MSAPTAAPCPVHAEFDPLSEDFLADPFAVMRALPLAEEPVFYAPSIDYYVVSRYADVEAVFLDPATYSAATAQLPLVPLTDEAREILLEGGHRPQPSMVSLDAEAHARLRRPAARALTPRRVEAMVPRIRATLTELLDAVDDTAPFDLVAALCFPLPATVIFAFMGVPEEDRAQLKEWCGHRATLAWGRPTPDEQVTHARAMALYRNYLRGLVAAKATDRGDDFASALLAIHDEDPQQLTHEEVASILFSLSFAGHETTNNLIGNCVRRLLEDPERWARLTAEPELIPGAVDEVLRYDPSVPVWRRVTTRPVTLGGVDLPAGAKLFLWLAATGRDAATFPEPDAFVPERPNARRTLAFGRGIHFCIGSALGRLEATMALEELTRRWPQLRLVEDAPMGFHPNISFRGPQRLWVGADQRAAASTTPRTTATTSTAASATTSARRRDDRRADSTP
jgi:cytochrome P450